jgi:hypothetical protein
MWLRVGLAGACLGALLGACALVDPVDSRYDTISRSLAKARNESILLNLVRASHDYPLSFVTVANVTPTMTNTSTLGLPAFLFGPNIGPPTTTSLFTPGRDVIFGNTTASNATAVSSNFNVSTQETSSFYEGFLKPIDLQVLDYFIRQGYSRELLFWLFTDSVEITFGGTKTFGTRYNPPEDFGCIRGDPKRRCFSDFVLVAIGAGVTVEEETLQKAGGAAGAGGQKTAGGGGGSKPETQIFTRFCFNQVFADRAHAAMGDALYYKVTHTYADLPTSQFQPKCGSHWDAVAEAEKPQPDSFPFTVGPITFKIVPRSAYGVFQFLGALIKMQREHPLAAETAYLPEERREEQQRVPILHTAPPGSDPYLVQVVPGNGDGQCFVHSWFYDGDYCVPEGATNTKRIFSLLAQLIAIQTAATDLSITPTVRVIQ